MISLAVATLAAGPLRSGSDTFVTGSHQLEVTYDIKQAVPDESIISLGDEKDLKQVDCDNDGSMVRLTFNDEQAAADFVNRSKQGDGPDGVFLTADAAHGCPMGNGQQQYIMRRIIDAFAIGECAQVRTASCQYGELIREGNISLASRRGDHPAHVCLGVNVADPSSCNSAAKPFPVFEKDELTLTCDSCFAGCQTEVFADVHLALGSATKVSGGFRNMLVNAAVDMDVKATEKKSFIAVDKEIFHMEQPVLEFNIGPIPFQMVFEAGARLTAQFSCTATQEGKIGATMQYNIGDAYVMWDRKNKWQTVKPTPNLTITPTLASHADLDCQGNFGIVPTVSLNLNQLLSQDLTLTSTLGVDIHGDIKSKEICETGDYDMNMVSSAKLHASLGLDVATVDAWWGPVTLGDRKGDLPRHCVGVNSTLALLEAVLV
mmetsp:Transcript_11040/g.27886  ORF Transcript_11040/g.27886 Transcript_11040/m.27886 type:complete len:432 (+) Transcript_11040:49-1344(+)